MSPLQGPSIPYGLHIRRTDHNPPCGPSAGRWVLTTANAAGANGLTYLSNHGRGRANTFLVTHPMTDQRCLTSTIARRSALTTEPTSSSIVILANKKTPNMMELFQISETPTFYPNYLAMRNTADVTGGKLIAVWAQSIRCKCYLSVYDIHGRKREVLLSRTPHETIWKQNEYTMCVRVKNK
jgi:hypothetical protein